MDKPARISLLWSFSSNSALLPGNHLAVEIVELPGEVNSYMTCLVCCVESGRIAVGMGSIVRILTLTAPGEDLESMEGRRPCSTTEYLSSEDQVMDMSSASESSGNPRCCVTSSHSSARLRPYLQDQKVNLVMQVCHVLVLN